MTLENVKSYLRITTNEWDSAINILIPYCLSEYKRIRNKEWDHDENGVVYPDNIGVVIPEMIAFKLFQSAPGSSVVASSRSTEIATAYQEEPLYYGWPKPIYKQIQRNLKGGL